MGGEYEYSSSSGTTTPLKRRTSLVCDCGSEAPLVTGWTYDNPGRRFYGCGRYFQRRECNFFRWYDPEVPERQKKIIRALLKKNDELQEKLKKCDELQEKLKKNDELQEKERKLAISKAAIVVLGVMLLISVCCNVFKLV
jgi:hypothetical protein